MPVSNYLAKKYIQVLQRNTGFSEIELERIRYALLSFSWEIEKIIYIFFLFAILGNAMLYLELLFIFLTIRFFAGGYHCKTSLACIIFTFSMFYVSIYVLPIITMNEYLAIALAAFSMIINIMYAPLVPLDKIKFAQNITHKKVLSSVITFGWLIIIMTNIDNVLFVAALWLIWLQNIELVFEYYRRRLRNLNDGERRI